MIDIWKDHITENRVGRWSDSLALITSFLKLCTVCLARLVTCRLLYLIEFDLFSFDPSGKIGNLFPSEASDRRGRFISPPELVELSRARLLCAGF